MNFSAASDTAKRNTTSSLHPARFLSFFSRGGSGTTGNPERCSWLLRHSASTDNSQQGFLWALILRLTVCNPWLDMHHAQRARHLPQTLLTVANPARNSLPLAVRQSLRGSTNTAQEQKPATSSAPSTQDGAEEPPLCPVAQEAALGVKPYLPILCFLSPNKAGNSWEDCKCTYSPVLEITLKNGSQMFKNGYYFP